MAEPPASWLAGAVPTAELPPDVCACIDRLARSDSWQMDGDEVTEPREFGQLVAFGARALPAIRHVVSRSEDQQLCHCLIDVAGRIGDPAALPMLHDLLHSDDSDRRSAATVAVARIGRPESLVVLQRLRETWPPQQQAELLAAMLRLGDTAVLGDLIRIGFVLPEQRFEVVQALLRHRPLRAALGFTTPHREGEVEPCDDDLLLTAAEEWHHERVLGQRSPWRSIGGEAFQPPFLDSKRAALQVLQQQVASGNGTGSVLRVHAVDPPRIEVDRPAELVVVSGQGHGAGLIVESWHVHETTCEGIRLAMKTGPRRSTFPGDDVVVDCSRVTMPTARYRELVVGLRTIFAARLQPWWSGPGISSTMTSFNFVASIDGLGVAGDAPRSYCGYVQSDGRRRFAPLLAATRWYVEFLARHGEVEASAITPAARRDFTAAMLRLQPCFDSDWWWVRERMLGMAGQAGDAGLRDLLVHYLAPKFAAGSDGMSRTAAAAISSLSTITGRDLRFTADGTPRPVAAAAELYRELLAR